MGMTEKEFGEMGVQTFFLKLFYFNQKREGEMRFNAEIARLQTFALINIQLSEKHKLKKPQDMFKYTWEEEEERKTKPQDPQTLAELVAKANKILNGTV